MFDRMDEHIYADTYGDEPGDYAELLELIHTRPAWHADAACKEYPEVNFFPHRDKAAKAAVAVCSGCLARAECQAWAMAQEPGLDGVWGGLTAADRAKLRREQRAA